MNKPKFETPNLTAENVTKIAELFPGVVSEGKVNFDLLRSMLGEDVFGDEAYEFTWVGKRAAIAEAGRPVRKTLRPCVEESKDWDTTENLYIEGDNLDVLKLLRETYLNRVKMIYIDPPYNTGNDFVYEDDFSEDADVFLHRDGQYDEQGNRLTANKDSNGRFHTDWLNMMYPRLRVARDLLSSDGVIFISIDENEVFNLKKIVDDIFGVQNYLTTITVKLRHENRILKGDKDFHEVVEFCLVYKKGAKYVQTKRVEDNTSNDDYVYLVEELTKPHATIQCGSKTVEVFRPDEYKIVKTTPNANNFKRISIRGSLKEGNSSGRFYMSYLDGITGEYDYLYKVPDVGDDKYSFRYFIRPASEKVANGAYFQGVPTNRTETKKVPFPNFIEMVNEFNNVGYEGDVEFRNGKKPTSFIRYLMKLAGLENNKDCICMDFFSGSSSTAHAVLQLNAEDKGKRRFVMVQIPEDLDISLATADSNSRVSILATIAFLDKIEKPHLITEIGKERIRRAGQKIKDEAGMMAQDLDIGFRVLKLDSSNMKDVYYTPDELEKLEFDFDGFTDNIKADRTTEDLLFQVMLELGIPLSAKIMQEGDLWCVNDNYLIACFDKVDTDLITDIAKKKPYYAVFRDSSFANDSAMVNFEQVFNTYSPNTIRRVL